MTDPLGSIPAVRRTGDEALHLRGTAHGTVAGIWSWAYSGLVGNTLRGALAEYIVALALGLAEGTRVEWDTVDLRLPDDPRVEVRSAAYLQEWAQSRPSQITFSIAATEGWDPQTGAIDTERSIGLSALSALSALEPAVTDFDGLRAAVAAAGAAVPGSRPPTRLPVRSAPREPWRSPW
ncbi:hypothetical protein LG634_09250 [Streptomyces bambusae]|uniref:hypothetical protein n=1 Tax=Streptomyces bambusae TaxID=1550616 RepID=UPI001CFCDD4B|nr:hypothetical protein [Streptomyces bambusae]MCB5165012.1 hypothetical protein [Streptomyces bambusae]